MSGLHTAITKVDPFSTKLADVTGSALGIKSDVAGDPLGITHEAKETRQKKAQEQMDALGKNRFAIPTVTPRKH